MSLQGKTLNLTEPRAGFAYQFNPAFLNLAPTDILDETILCCGAVCAWQNVCQHS